MNDFDTKLKNEIWRSFNKEQHVFLATAEGDQPKVRPVTLIYLDGKFYVATGTNDAKVKQISQNPRIEFCMLLEANKHKGTLRAQCMANIILDGDQRARVFNNVSFSKEFWTGSEDPNFTLIELQPTLFEYMKPNTTEAVKMTV